MIVWDEKEGERRKWPLGERERDVGVSVCPMRVWTSSFLRKSMTYSGVALNMGKRVYQESSAKTYVNLIVQCSRKYACPVCAPSDRGDWAPKLVHAHRLLRALVSPLPNADGAIITASGHELDASTSCESSVEGINDTTVSVEFTHALASREVCDVQGVVCGDSI